jgi:hypothetical protein
MLPSCTRGGGLGGGGGGGGNTGIPFEMSTYVDSVSHSDVVKQLNFTVSN